jgi:TolB-like protein/class 3 adenylate cyclase/Tfp pilus assembly protein PilF
MPDNGRQGTPVFARMASEIKKEIQLEIAHVLFIDIVGYSKLSINEQRAAVDELTKVVRSSDQYQKAEAAARLIKISTGDGMALVFYTSPEAPAHCAVEISRARKDHPRLQLRMGIHSGPVSGVIDVNYRPNLAGAGLNMAQRVMDCGDAGHILLSKHVAEDLEEYEQWRPLLHDLGTYEVKHGVRVGVTNLYSDEVGNPQLPEKFLALKRHRSHVHWAQAAMALLVLAAVVAAFIFVLRKPTRSVLSVAEKSIAVLPFENLSQEKANAFFADGVQDEILTHLARIADLKVISRTSVMQYKAGVVRNLREIGQQLGVAHLLEGSVQRAANRVRVNAKLIDARTDAHLWAQTYDRDLADVFAIQSEIAKAIADQLQARLSPNEKAAIEKPPTADLAAFDLYTRAKTLLLTTSFTPIGEQNLRQAVELLNQATTRDPAFFEAYYQLAFVHGRLYSLGFDHTASRLASAEAALQAAIRLRPDAGETHLARANYLYYGPRDYAGALAELEYARRNLPNDPRLFELTGYILRRRGQQEEGLRNLEKAIELDPRNYFIMQQIALSYQFLRRYPEEAVILDRALTIVPKDVATKVNRALVDFYWKADTKPLHQAIDSILAGDPGAISEVADSWFVCALAEHDRIAAERALVALGDNPWWVDAAVILRRSFGEGLLARVMKDEAKARAAFSKASTEQEKTVQAQPDYGPALCVLGLIDAALGSKEAALEEARRAIELLPVEKDSVNGSRMLVYFAIVAAWASENELALQQLELGVRAPNPSQALNYGALKLLPFWDPLRGDPRFEKIVASLAPKL